MHIGLEACDELLSVVAARLVRAVRGSDVVCRLASDEFTCLLTALPHGRVQLSRLACKLFDTVSNPITVGRLSLSVRPRIGIAIWPMHGSTAEALFESADAAREHAKRYQSGYAFFDGPAAVQIAPRVVGGSDAMGAMGPHAPRGDAIRLDATTFKLWPQTVATHTDL